MAISAVLPVKTKDRFAIIELTHKFCYYVDHFELDPLMTLWAEDATYDTRPVGLYKASGFPQISEFFARDFAITLSCVHYQTNHILERVDDTNIRGVSYCLVQQDLHSGDTVQATVCCDDTYVRVGERWLFTSRIVTALRPPKTTGLLQAGTEEGVDEAPNLLA